jgi:hypothetical protein
VNVLIEGIAADDLLAWPIEQLRQLLTLGRPVVFSAGSATVLAELRRENDSLIIELAHIDGGGEGVLPTLWRFGNEYARAENVKRIDWRIHATRCANPNPRLPGVLLKMGFAVEELPIVGAVYRRVDLR